MIEDLFESLLPDCLTGWDELLPSVYIKQSTFSSARASERGYSVSVLRLWQGLHTDRCPTVPDFLRALLQGACWFSVATSFTEMLLSALVSNGYEVFCLFSRTLPLVHWSISFFLFHIWGGSVSVHIWCPKKFYFFSTQYGQYCLRLTINPLVQYRQQHAVHSKDTSRIQAEKENTVYFL